MSAGIHRAAVAGAVLSLALVCACGGRDATELKLAPSLSASPAAALPSAEQLSRALDAELARLGVDPAKVTAKAPGAGNAVFDLVATIIDPDGAGPLPPTGVELSWSERCVGDYDQNGEVNAADLAPLGLHFGAAVAYRSPGDAGGLEWWPAGDPRADVGVADPLAVTGAENWRLARIDGSFDGELDLGDVTPIAQHWRERLDGYRVYRRGPSQTEYQLLADPADPAAPLTIPRSAAFAAGADSADPLKPVLYRFIDAVTDFGPFEYYVVPFDAGSGQEGSHSASGMARSNRQPVAALNADVQSGTAPLAVTLGAGISSDPDGLVLTFSWDFEGDGIYDLDTGPSYTVTHVYEYGGIYHPTVLVTDADGATDTSSGPIFVNTPPQAALTLTPSTGDAPLSVTLDASGSADPDGQLALYEFDCTGDGVYETSFIDQSSCQFTYTVPGNFTPTVRVTDAQGSTSVSSATLSVFGWHHVVIDRAGRVGTYLSGAIVDGVPAVAYWKDTPDNDLKYCRAADAFGLTWAAPQVIAGAGDTSGDVGQYPSLQVVAGNPAVAYHDAGQRALCYIRAADPQGAIWNPPVVANADDNPGINNSMQVVNGVPAIAYFTLATSSLCYVHALDADGTSWDTPYPFEGLQFYRDLDLVVIDGFAALGYLNFDGNPFGSWSGSYFYQRANDAAGDDWSDGQPAYTTSVSWGFGGASLAVVNNLPACTLYIGSTSVPYDLTFMLASDALGSAWPQSSIIASGFAAAGTSSLAVIGGLPCCAYSCTDRAGSGWIMFARATDEFGTSWNEPVQIDDGIGDMADLKLLEVQGQPAIIYQDVNDSDLLYAVYGAF